MLWVHVSDLVDGREIDPEQVPRVFAYIEARVAYETLSKVVQLLYEARARNMVSEKLVDIVADWLSEVEAEYRIRAELVDPWFYEARQKLARLAARKAEPSAHIAGQESLGEVKA